MLSILHHYSHGYLAIPVLLSCKKRGLFDLLQQNQSTPFSQIVHELHANSTHLRSALHMLESLQILCRDSEDGYALLTGWNVVEKIPEEVVELFDFPMKEYFKKSQRKYRLQKWIELSAKQWNIDNVMYSQFLDGMVMIPLLFSLNEQKFILQYPSQQHELLFHNLSGVAKQEITQLFLQKNWLDQTKKIGTFTETGMYMLDGILNTAAIYSYHPIIKNIDELLFGDCQAVLTRDGQEYGAYMDRMLQGLKYGFHQEEYVRDMEQIVISIFDREPLEEQPKYIANMGCGNGALLKKIYEIIKMKSLRGKRIDQYPLTLIGIDNKEESLIETATTLKDIKHVLLKGTIGNPNELITTIREGGIPDTENILYVRSFLDHDRPFIVPEDTDETNCNSFIPTKTVFVDETGRECSSKLVKKKLIEHLQLWSHLVNKHGFILLEAHCLEPKTISQHIDKCESFHFDTIHRFSQKLLVEADTFILAAAEVGLFPHKQYFRKYPKAMPFSRITLNYFEQRDYKIRMAHEHDISVLRQLELQCWGEDLAAPAEKILHRIKKYPEGQLVLEVDNRVIGVIYSQKIREIKDIKTSQSNTVEQFHHPEGTIIQLLAINILPEMQDRKLGDQLLEFMLQRCSLISEVRSVIGITKCKDYQRYSTIDKDKYITLRNKNNKLVDKTLRFHEMHGAKIKELIPNYRPLDVANLGYGVLVEYDILNRGYCESLDKVRNQECLEKKCISIQTGNSDLSKAITDFVLDSIGSLLDKERKDVLAYVDRPLMELGLDSGDLLELNDQLGTRFQIELKTTFFFTYNTARKIISYLIESLDEVEQVSVAEESVSENEIVARTNPYVQKDDIAIIGASCRLPGGVSNLEELWELLINNRNAIRPMPEHRWDWPDTIHPDSEHKGIDQGGFLDNIAEFDPLFFRISPTEAEILDPQQRLLMELSWECIEGANYSATAISGSNTGVFIGASGSDYSKLLDRYSDDVQAKYGIGTSMAILPNRISYFYNLHGPSIQIDTACSSSLVAVHQAVKSLQAGECEQALVGGVHLMCHPANSIAYYKAGMLSRDGKCKTFDKDANGYVRGEGGVVLLLKPVKQAKLDGDSIMAVIKGTATNHGGQANGLTVPNPAKQATLIKEAFRSADIAPESVGYMEAHGTGTSLGDPIEFAALKDAFLELSQQDDNKWESYCGLGSIKTNIGHLEAAAGLAGLAKVLVSLRHRMIPASLHFQVLNPHIPIENSPFYIVNSNQEWMPPHRGGLRRAGVSSFGSGGSNAHIVIEEYPSTDKVDTKRDTSSSNPVMIVLSAKNEERLEEHVRQLLQAIKKQNLTDFRLKDMAYTLHVGREAMEERFATVISHIEELEKSLLDYLDNKGTLKNNYQGNVNKNNSISSLSIGHEEKNEMVNHFIHNNDLHQLAYLWVSGLDIDWQELYRSETDNRRISLPTYPFAREHYWLSEIESRTLTSKPKKITSGTQNVIHPLLQQNTSYLSTTRFSSTFTGKELFLRDHVVNGCKVLPGVAHLEMARKAMEQVLEDRGGDHGGFQLHNVIWKKPILLEEQSKQVHVRVFSGNHDEINYEIYSEEISGSDNPIVYSQGVALRWEEKKTLPLDVPTLLSECNQRVLTGRECYQAFHKVGIAYGKSHQGIQSVHVGKDQVLAELVLPSSLEDTQEQYVLHPSLMDAALQASLVFQMQLNNTFNTSVKPSLPFALETMEIIRPYTPKMWAHVRHSEDYISGNETQKYDIDLCDDRGTVCVRMSGFSSRVLEGDISTDCSMDSTSREAIITHPFEPMLVSPIWEVIPHETGQRIPSIDDNLVIVGGNETNWSDIRKQYPHARVLPIHSGNTVEEIIRELRQHAPIGHIFWMAPEEHNSSITDDAIIEGQEAGVIYLFKIIKSLLALGYDSRPIGWTVITIQAQPIHKYDEVNPTHASIHGLMGTLAKEYSHWKIRVIDLESVATWPMPELFTLPSHEEGNAYVYREQQWHHQELVPVRYNKQGETLYKNGGVYVVIGGAGGIGEVWSEYVIRMYEAKVIWIGRREKDAKIQAKIDRLASVGPTPSYIVADATDQEELYRAYEEIKQQYGHIHGIVHSAIVLLDKSLANMDEERFRAGLRVKVDVSVNIAEVFEQEPLDFVLFFSSMNSFVKAAGQSNYVAGCTFKDAFASQLALEWPCAVKVMNWGYWGTVGTVASEEYQRRMHNRGVGSIEPPEAMEALEALLIGPMNQLAFAKMTSSSAWVNVNRRKCITIYQ
ncbi:type I polyketide synthase [Brevibacillus laterosporus]|uniref:type I polyketide synthase n=4 Tax=Brevibacillus laterosporus TaxID=1465 RepID=UPI00215CB16B|nr:type I polyketide synthase [Brevibacillus laterosporus]MCR8936409.1 type I polyketide synthase [Brevibacillus laterosporus]MCZ0839048.1 type I polyketide synthase [Brevibacillus laterosporus]MED1910270.1 type I polyketide synthase [Brevibacillus laterosporus]